MARLAQGIITSKPWQPLLRATVLVLARISAQLVRGKGSGEFVVEGVSASGDVAGLSRPDTPPVFRHMSPIRALPVVVVGWLSGIRGATRRRVAPRMRQWAAPPVLLCRGGRRVRR